MLTPPPVDLDALERDYMHQREPDGVRALITECRALRAEVAELRNREPTQEEADAIAAGASEAFVNGRTARRCCHCERWVFGGPTACIQCANFARHHDEIEVALAQFGAQRDAAELEAAGYKLERDGWEIRANEARAALEEREADMHVRIRAGYDKTVADCWRAKVAEVEKERDEARAKVAELEKPKEIPRGLVGHLDSSHVRQALWLLCHDPAGNEVTAEAGRNLGESIARMITELTAARAVVEAARDAVEARCACGGCDEEAPFMVYLRDALAAYDAACKVKP